MRTIAAGTWGNLYHAATRLPDRLSYQVLKRSPYISACICIPTTPPRVGPPLRPDTIQAWPPSPAPFMFIPVWHLPVPLQNQPQCTAPSNLLSPCLFAPPRFLACAVRPQSFPVRHHLARSSAFSLQIYVCVSLQAQQLCIQCVPQPYSRGRRSSSMGTRRGLAPRASSTPTCHSL